MILARSLVTGGAETAEGHVDVEQPEAVALVIGQGEPVLALRATSRRSPQLTQPNESPPGPNAPEHECSLGRARRWFLELLPWARVASKYSFASRVRIGASPLSSE
jgi:hypothetical protein